MTIDITSPIFTAENAAREHLEAQRWPHGPSCPHCGEAEQITKLEGKKHRPGVYQCNSCRQQFTVTVGTVFERSKIPLHKWLLATYLLSASKKGMSSHQLHRMLGVTYKTAWFMTHRIREAMREPAGSGPLGGPNTVVEVDETFVGGKAKNRADGRVPTKEAVMAAPGASSAGTEPSTTRSRSTSAAVSGTPTPSRATSRSSSAVSSACITT